MGTIADGVARMKSDLWDLSSRIHLWSAERFIKTRSGRDLAAWPRADDFSVKSSKGAIKTEFVALLHKEGARPPLCGGGLFEERADLPVEIIGCPCADGQGGPSWTLM
jgi:hypothetical protein